MSGPVTRPPSLQHGLRIRGPNCKAPSGEAQSLSEQYHGIIDCQHCDPPARRIIPHQCLRGPAGFVRDDAADPPGRTGRPRRRVRAMPERGANRHTEAASRAHHGSMTNGSRAVLDCLPAPTSSNVAGKAGAAQGDTGRVRARIRGCAHHGRGLVVRDAVPGRSRALDPNRITAGVRRTAPPGSAVVRRGRAKAAVESTRARPPAHFVPPEVPSPGVGVSGHPATPAAALEAPPPAPRRLHVRRPPHRPGPPPPLARRPLAVPDSPPPTA